nr:nucleotide exchange factor GrpE [Desertifilum tharense]
MMIDEEKQFDNTPDSTSEVSDLPEDATGVSSSDPEEVSAAAFEAEDVPIAEATAEPALEEQTALDAEALLAEVARKDAEVETLKAQLKDLNNQSIRIAADFDNFRKRTQKEKEEFEQQVKCSTLKELLPVVDNFERARSQIKPQSEAEMSIHKSYQSVYKQLVDCLKRIGVSPMRSEGKEFDPNLHEAVMREATDQYEEGVVMEELMRGYLLGDRVLRHAMVKVAAAPEPGDTSTATETPTAEAENAG